MRPAGDRVDHPDYWPVILDAVQVDESGGVTHMTGENVYSTPTDILNSASSASDGHHRSANRSVAVAWQRDIGQAFEGGACEQISLDVANAE